MVIATGSTPRVEPFDYLPRVEGIDQALNVRDVMDGKVATGDTVAIYAGDNGLQALAGDEEEAVVTFSTTPLEDDEEADDTPLTHIGDEE